MSRIIFIPATEFRMFCYALQRFPIVYYIRLMGLYFNFSDLDKIVRRDNRLTNDGSSESFDYCTKSTSSSPVKSPSDELPPGWERHQGKYNFVIS